MKVIIIMMMIRMIIIRIIIIRIIIIIIIIILIIIMMISESERRRINVISHLSAVLDNKRRTYDITLMHSIKHIYFIYFSLRILN